jgi:hypothetical protein
MERNSSAGDASIDQVTRPSVESMLQAFELDDDHAAVTKVLCTDGETRTIKQLFVKLLDEMPETIKCPSGVALMKKITLKNGNECELYFEVSDDCPGAICYTNKTTGREGDYAHLGQIAVRMVAFDMGISSFFKGASKFWMPAQVITDLNASAAAGSNKGE